MVGVFNYQDFQLTRQDTPDGKIFSTFCRFILTRHHTPSDCKGGVSEEAAPHLPTICWAQVIGWRGKMPITDPSPANSKLHRHIPTPFRRSLMATLIFSPETDGQASIGFCHDTTREFASIRIEFRVPGHAAERSDTAGRSGATHTGVRMDAPVLGKWRCLCAPRSLG